MLLLPLPEPEEEGRFAVVVIVDELAEVGLVVVLAVVVVARFALLEVAIDVRVAEAGRAAVVRVAAAPAPFFFVPTVAVVDVERPAALKGLAFLEILPESSSSCFLLRF